MIDPSHLTIIRVDQVFTRALERVAVDSADLVAYRFRDRAISYSDFVCRVESLARVLRPKVNEGHVVGVYLNRSHLTPIALLAIWRARCVYVPLDVKYPDQYIEHILRENNVRIVLTASDLTEDLSRFGVEIIELDTLDLRDDSTDLPEHPELESIAAIMYTSGSTGLPKGVMHTHRNLLNHVGWYASSYPLPKGSVLIQRTSVAFYPSLRELTWGLLVSGTTVVLSDDAARDPDQLSRAISEHELCGKVGDDGLREAAYRGGCRACQN
ncbi:AMP-binding protein, partial [Bradyrhizobium sp. Leaf401]|uniref:AMP-binding protein n=1 Tax=Bradyrhizobium sp. Leaf401 TaxID=2876564 RepID=UPI001E318CA8